ncbi:MAG: hypothetical protein KGL22_06200 [Alphaproteobacteria bacterium]|nr:hypothetical protein [Alphaproteobacteria bacterium]
MRRVLPVLTVVALLFGAGGVAYADCAQDIAALRSRIVTLDDPAKQRELELLLAKAQNDNDAGRTNLCADDLRRAQQLVK